MVFPDNEPSGRRAHLDTDVLRAGLGADDDKDLISEARQFIHSGKQLTACACITALGELVLTLSQDYPRLSDALRSFCDSVKKGEIVLFGLGEGDTEFFRLADEIREREPNITPADALIIASFLEDQLSDILCTTDTQIVESRILHDMAREREKSIHELGK